MTFSLTEISTGGGSFLVLRVRSDLVFIRFPKRAEGPFQWGKISCLQALIPTVAKGSDVSVGQSTLGPDAALHLRFARSPSYTMLHVASMSPIRSESEFAALRTNGRCRETGQVLQRSLSAHSRPWCAAQQGVFGLLLLERPLLQFWHITFAHAAKIRFPP